MVQLREQIVELATNLGCNAEVGAGVNYSRSPNGTALGRRWKHENRLLLALTRAQERHRIRSYQPTRPYQAVVPDESSIPLCRDHKKMWSRKACQGESHWSLQQKNLQLHSARKEIIVVGDPKCGQNGCSSTKGHRHSRNSRPDI